MTFLKSERQTAGTTPEGVRAEQLAQRFGVEIPPHIREALWSLPILEAMERRLESLERDLALRPYS